MAPLFRRLLTLRAWHWPRLPPIGDLWPLLWILVLAFLSVGARNFEDGLSIDAPLYATIARNILSSGDWFRLDPGVVDFAPFTEHPHLGFWLLAAVFKVLPAADWAARLPGHFFYVGFLLLFFVSVRRYSGEKAAVGAVLLLWIWSRFSNTFSNVYLDPGALCFGFAAVLFCVRGRDTDDKVAAGFAGMALALCAMAKGLTALGFLPTVILLALWPHAESAKATKIVFFRKAAFLGSLWLGFALVVVPYVFLVSRSRCPDFFHLYWSRQMTQRFSTSWHWASLFARDFWMPLLKDTYFLAPLGLLFLRRRREVYFWIPMGLFVTFVFLYAPAQRIGSQYWIMLMPWIAWAIGAEVLSRLPFDAKVLAKRSAAVAIAAVFVIQYFPMRTHKFVPPEPVAELARLSRSQGMRKLHLAVARVVDSTFIAGAPYAWYGRLSVDYLLPQAPIPQAASDTACVLLDDNAARRAGLARSGWCLHRAYTASSLWLACAGR